MHAGRRREVRWRQPPVPAGGGCWSSSASALVRAPLQLCGGARHAPGRLGPLTVMHVSWPSWVMATLTVALLAGLAASAAPPPPLVRLASAMACTRSPSRLRRGAWGRARPPCSLAEAAVAGRQTPPNREAPRLCMGAAEGALDSSGVAMRVAGRGGRRGFGTGRSLPVVAALWVQSLGLPWHLG